MLGLSRADWIALTPQQYSLFRESHYRRQQRDERERWELARWQVFRTLCPPSGKRISLKDIITFPWEAAPSGSHKGGEKNKDRFDKLVKRWNDGERQDG